MNRWKHTTLMHTVRESPGLAGSPGPSRGQGGLTGKVVLQTQSAGVGVIKIKRRGKSVPSSI